MGTRYHLTVFQTTTDTMAAEEALKECGIEHAIMPTPRAVTASCGLAIRFAPELTGRVTSLLTERLGEGRFQIYAAISENGHIGYVISAQNE